VPSRKIGDYYRVPVAAYRPRLSFVRGYRVEADAQRAWSRIANGELDVTREVFLDREPTPQLPRDTSRPLLVARLVEDLPERVTAELTTANPGLLVLTDLSYPGWTAQVDGKPAALYAA